jgi:hypothetical protein
MMSRTETPRRVSQGGVNFALMARRHLFPHWSLWVPLLGLAAINMVWVLLEPRFSLSSRSIFMMSLVLIGCPLALLYRHLRGPSFDRLLDALFRMLMVVLFAGLLTQQLNLFNHLSMSLAMPLADGWLNAWDRALGFDWNGYAAMVAAHPWIYSLLAFAYGPFIGIAFAALVVFPVWLGRYERVNEVAFLALTSAFICIGLAALFPAEAAWITIATPETKTLLGEQPGLYWADQFSALRGSGPVVLNLREMQGLATFPSFHACLGLIIMWGSRGHWLTFLVGSIGGLGVLAATPVFGWHYAVDLLAGAMVVAGAILLWQRVAPSGKGEQAGT